MRIGLLFFSPACPLNPFLGPKSAIYEELLKMKVNKKIVIGLICLVPLIMTGIVLAGSDEEGMVKSRGVEQI
jgi:hypothetical protein